MKALVHLVIVSLQLIDLFFKLYVLVDLLLGIRVPRERRVRLDKYCSALCGLGQLSMEQRQRAFSLGRSEKKEKKRKEKQERSKSFQG